MWFFEEGRKVDQAQKHLMMLRLLQESKQRFQPGLKRVLLLPPDITRLHSGTGQLTNMLYHMLEGEAHVDVIPTLGQHVPHTPEENRQMFGDIPQERILDHHWRDSVKTYGEVPADYVKHATGGLVDWPVPVQIHKAVVDGGYDLVINLGQVVPHEVLGFANHNKNYFIGLGGKDMICASHMAAGTYGIERNLGQIITPLRGCYNKAERDCLGGVPDVYVLVVNTRNELGDLETTGLYVGEDVETYMRAARYSRQHSITMFDQPLKKCVCIMDAAEFHSTWVGNKAVYRTRMAMADGGELIVVAPGVKRFGEQDEVDRMIRKYGYKGTQHTLEAYHRDAELRDLAHAAAHLLHGSSEGRFTITYAAGHLTREEVESVGFNYMPCDEALAKYDPRKLKDGMNTVGGEDVFFISSPSMGLWSAKPKYVESVRTNLEFAQRMQTVEPEVAAWKQLEQWNREDLETFGS